MMRINTDDLIKIDNAFSQLIENHGDRKALSTIIEVLNKSFNKRFSIIIADRSVESTVCFFTITPSENIMNDIVVGLMNGMRDNEIADKWNSSNQWNVSIDSRLLTGELFPVTNRELTAMLLHECGHVIDSNMIPYRICRAMKFQSSQLGLGMRAISSNGIFVKILQVPIIKACSLKKDSMISLQKEMRADLYASKCGYGQELDSVFKKILEFNDGLPKNMGRTIGDEKLQEMENDMIFSLDTINAIKKRDSRLVFNNFSRMVLMLPSEFGKAFSSSVANVVMRKNNKTYEMNESFSDSVDSMYENAYMKEAFAIFKKKMKRIDPSIVDYVMIRKDSIKSNDEKLMLVQYIYSKLDLVNYYLDIMNNPKYERRYVFMNSKSELLRIKEALEQLRVAILNYKVPVIQYGININYPEGYLG